MCSGGRDSLNASESFKLAVQIPGPKMAIQLEVDQQPPPSIKEMHTSDHDLEKSGPGASDSEKAISIRVPGPKTESLDIEHVPVQNDPRKWSSFRKVSF